MTARELSLIGRDLHQRGPEQDTIAACAMFLRATEVDPGFAAPYAWAAFTLMRVVTFAWSAASHGGAEEEAVRLAARQSSSTPNPSSASPPSPWPAIGRKRSTRSRRPAG